jgi:pimeloyl-ACP methyl ester carboxylesterase
MLGAKPALPSRSRRHVTTGRAMRSIEAGVCLLHARVQRRLLNAKKEVSMNTVKFPGERAAAASANAAKDIVPLPRPAWLPEDAWTFKTSALSVNGRKIAFTDVGQGPVLLFVHTGLWSFIWRDVILRLSCEFRCVCFDAPGTGQSDRVKTGEISLAQAAGALVSVITALDLRDVTLVFHDLGGPSGLAGAAQVAPRIRAFCAVNSFAWRPSGLKFRGMLALMGSAALREFDVLTSVLMRVTASPFGVGRRMNERDRNAFLAGIGPEGIRAFHAYMRDARQPELYDDITDALIGRFRDLPLMTIFGERNDPLGFQARWKRLYPNALQVVVPKGNHFPMCDDPDLVALSIQQWRRRWVTPAPT